MAQTSVAQFATDLKMPATALLEQLQMAGVVKSNADGPGRGAQKAGPGQTRPGRVA